nr:GNAT family N-acetyltransferase [Caulobacter sp. 17J65-9]
MKPGGERFNPLKIFARKNARRYEEENLARTYVIHDRPNNRIAAYVTLVCSEVVSGENLPLVNGENLHFPYDTYPAVKIARLLVDDRYRGENSRGLGRILVNFAQGIARAEICPAVGCRFVVVDSKQESIGFYERCGFTMVDTHENRSRTEPVMYLDLHKAS